MAKNEIKQFAALNGESGAFNSLIHDLSRLIDDIQETKDIADVKKVANIQFSAQLDMTLGETLASAKEHISGHMEAINDKTICKMIDDILAKY